jgi:hypothetical protein
LGGGDGMNEFLEGDVVGDTAEKGGSSSGPRHGRRLSDKILVAFHHACDAQDLVVAEQLLKTLESMLTRRGVPAEQNRRRALESLVAAHERLWHLRHKEK